MKKTIILLLIGIALYSCVPVKKIVSETYTIDEEIGFKIMKYLEPVNAANFRRSNDAKYAVIEILMTNHSSDSKNVNFENFYISDSEENTKVQLWRVMRTFDVAGTQYQNINFEASASKNLELWFIIPKNSESKFLYFDSMKVRL